MVIDDKIVEALRKHKKQLEELNAQQAEFLQQEQEARTAREALSISKIAAETAYNKTVSNLIKEICK